MSKYDFKVDLSQNSSTGIILNKIKKGSVVLEFGCATGRMTRYMKEVLGCQVYIVEYDQAAYEMARNYAEDGLCDDILNFQWLETFKGKEFDVIIFADVLEHLTAPEKVLESASKLLKDTGCIYASIPNVTHNDILLKAYEERFDYTSTGLLDDTHIHFWGLENIGTLASRCGLHIGKVEGTYCATGHTEQYEQTGKQEHRLLENILKERRCGEVYQFIVTFYKNDGLAAACEWKVPSIQSHVYLDTGNNFNVNELIAFDSEYSGRGSYAAHYVIDNPGDIKRVRFDPVELQGCILREVSISQGTQKLHLIYHHAVEMGSGLLLLGEDPMVYANVLAKDEPIVIDADIVLWGETFLGMVQDSCANQYSELSDLSEKVSRLTNQEQVLQRRNDHLSGENQALQERVAHLSGENEALRRDVGAYILLANYKDSYSLELEREVKHLSGENAALFKDVNAYVALTEQKNTYISTLEQDLECYKRELNYYQNLKVIRLRAYIVRILKGIKRRMKRVMRKEEHG